MLWACLEAAAGNQWMTKLSTMPIAIATTAAMAVMVIDRCLDTARRAVVCFPRLLLIGSGILMPSVPGPLRA